MSMEAYLDQLLLESQLQDSGFTPKLINAAHRVWTVLDRFFRINGLSLLVPDACPGENNTLMFVWDRDGHYLECEILEDGRVEFFYRDRNNGTTWGEDTAAGTHPSLAIALKLMLFIDRGNRSVERFDCILFNPPIWGSS